MYQRIVCCYEDLGIRKILNYMVFVEIQEFNPQMNTNEIQMDAKEKLLTFSESGVVFKS